ncbi:hypothetical protein HNR19_004346 [Nocardioides thalensis]|uniref:DUF2188 domain-containing protein n=1 Tax=Nocardioides thalensis TaxID=1914755 RepID=A0A853CB57_9ACTN|nr:hypothetical protein [Nocardioides thalensis]
MPAGDVETVFVDGQWTNQIEGEGLSHLVFDTQEEAAAEGRRLAKHAEVGHVVKNPDGTVVERSSYRSDAHDVAG